MCEGGGFIPERYATRCRESAYYLLVCLTRQVPVCVGICEPRVVKVPAIVSPSSRPAKLQLRERVDRTLGCSDSDGRGPGGGARECQGGCTRNEHQMCFHALLPEDLWKTE